MAESVDALVSNTSGATRAGSTPALGTLFLKDNDLSVMLNELSFFLFVAPHNVPCGRQFIKTNTYLCNALRQTTYSLPAVLNSYIHLYYKYA